MLHSGRKECVYNVRQCGGKGKTHQYLDQAMWREREGSPVDQAVWREREGSPVPRSGSVEGKGRLTSTSIRQCGGKGKAHQYLDQAVWREREGSPVDQAVCMAREG